MSKLNKFINSKIYRAEIQIINEVPRFKRERRIGRFTGKTTGQLMAGKGSVRML
jgi:hypothetical protein